MADFLQNYGTLLGAGVGILPQLLQHLFGQNGKDFGAGSGDGGTSLANPNLPQEFRAPDNNTHGYAGGGADGIYSATMSNYTPQGSNMGQAGQPSGLAGLMGALNPQRTSAPQGGQVFGTPLQPPSNSGGPNLANLIPQLGASVAQLGPGGLPLGQAALNPLSVFFKNRLNGGM